MQKNKQENSLELFFKQAQKLLSNPAIDDKCDIRLDCANITDVDYEIPKNIVSNTYPILEPKTLKAFRVKLSSLGVDLNNLDVGVTHSVFEFLKAALSKIVIKGLLSEPQQKTKILLPKGQFGYFYDIIKKSGAEPILVDINKDGKVNLDDLREKMITAKQNSCVGFMFLNPINPSQVVYSQDDVDVISSVLHDQNPKESIDFAFEDMTFMDVHNKRYDESLFDEKLEAERLKKRSYTKEDGKIRGRSNSVDDSTRFAGQKSIGTLSKTSISDKTILLYSLSKSYTASARISSFAVPHGLFEDLELGTTNIGSYEFPSESQARVQSTVLGIEKKQKHIFNYDSIPIEVIGHYKAMHHTYASKCDAINKMLSEKLSISPYHEFISVEPKEWKSTNVANLDFSGFKNFPIGDTKLTNGIDVFTFLVNQTGTKTIPCEANFIKDVQVRVSLGEKEEKINGFFDRLSECLLSAEIQKDSQITNLMSSVKEKLNITNMNMLESEGNLSMIERVKKAVQREKLSEQRSKSQATEKIIDF